MSIQRIGCPPEKLLILYTVVANPARGLLNREIYTECVCEKSGENYTFPVLVRARECRLARQVRPSRPASACCSFLTLKTECGAFLWGSSLYHLYVEQTAPAAAESRACVRENCAMHFYGFFGTAAAFCTTD